MAIPAQDLTLILHVKEVKIEGKTRDLKPLVERLLLVFLEVSVVKGALPGLVRSVD